MENVKKFYEALQADKAMQERANALNEKAPEGEDAVAEAIIAFASKEGYSFTADQLKAYKVQYAKSELNDDELEAVAGGAYHISNCFCIVGGGGKNEKTGQTCACVIGGGGPEDKDGTLLACAVMGFVVTASF